MTTLIEYASSLLCNSLHRSRHARQLGGEPYALPDTGVRMVMSDFGMAAYHIWCTGADQRTIESSHRRKDAMANPSAYSTLAGLRGRWQRMRRNRRSMAELVSLPPNEIRHRAQDVGLNHADLRSLGCSQPGPTQLMPWRLQQLGIDPTYVNVAETATYQDLERVCSACKAWRRCARDLAKGDVQAGMGSYCLNAFTIDMLTVDRPLPSRV
jgi:hypothetical protein